MQKEQMIEHKLAAITKLLLATKESANSNWKAMIEEDRLLTRIDILERQLETSHKVFIWYLDTLSYLIPWILTD